MKRYKIHTLDGEIEFNLIPAEDADSYYQTILKQDNPELEEYIFNSITENRYLEKELPAGIIPLVVFTSIKLSGVMEGKFDFIDAVERVRKVQEKNSFFNIYQRIVSVFNHYKLENLRKMTFNELIELMIFAENIYGKPFIDTRKAREEIAKKEEEESSIAPSKRGVKTLTKQDLDRIKAAINYNDHSNML